MSPMETFVIFAARVSIQIFKAKRYTDWMKEKKKKKNHAAVCSHLRNSCRSSSSRFFFGCVEATSGFQGTFGETLYDFMMIWLDFVDSQHSLKPFFSGYPSLLIVANGVDFLYV